MSERQFKEIFRKKPEILAAIEQVREGQKLTFAEAVNFFLEKVTAPDEI